MKVVTVCLRSRKICLSIQEVSATVNSTSFTTDPLTVNNDMEITIYTTEVIINSFDSNNNPLSDVTSYFLGSSTVNLGTSGAGGIVTAELFPGDRLIRSHYKGTNNTQTINVLGNGHSQGISTVLNTYTSEVKFIASSHNNEKVSGVQLRYTAGGSTTNQSGSTDANGERILEMYPGVYVFNGTKNGTTQTRSVTIDGTGTTSGSKQIEKIELTRVKFHNSGTVWYSASGSTYSISGENFYMFPGDYTLLFQVNNYSRTVSISGTNFEKAAAIIRLKDSNGDLASIDGIRGGVSSINYHVSATNGGYHISNESPGVWIDISAYNANTSRIYEVTQNGTTSTQSKDLMTNNIFDFQTDLLTLRLQKCNTDGISGGSIRWGFSVSGSPTISRHWASYPVTSSQTDANGNTSLEVFSGNFIFEMNYASSQQVKANVPIAGNSTITWQTTNVKIHYKGTNSSIAYGVSNAGTWWTYPVNGQELLPGILKFDFKDNGANLIDIKIPEQCTTFEKTAVIARLLSSSATPLSGGNVNYYENAAWHSVANSTAANGNTVYLLDENPGITTLEMNYLGVGQQKSNINLSLVNYVVLFQTAIVTMTLVDKDDNSIEADTGTLHYYDSVNGWVAFGSGSTLGGSETMELLPSNISFAMTLNGTREEKLSWDVGTTPTVPFKASKVGIHYIDSNCQPKQGFAASYYANGLWRAMGTTDNNGNSSLINMLPGGAYSFKAGLLPQQDGIVIQGVGIEQLVEFAEEDLEKPQITVCPPDYTISGCGVNAITGLLYSEVPVAVTLAEFTSVGGVATDNCSVVSYTYSDIRSSNDCTVVVTRTWVVKDAAGNQESCTQEINIGSSLIITNPMIRSRVK